MKPAIKAAGRMFNIGITLTKWERGGETKANILKAYRTQGIYIISTMKVPFDEQFASIWTSFVKVVPVIPII